MTAEGKKARPEARRMDKSLSLGIILYIDFGPPSAGTSQTLLPKVGPPVMKSYEETRPISQR
jgi:hypothetical protein